MFGTYFYHKRVRTAVSVFGSLFNDLYVLRQNSSGEVISQQKVPLSYAPRRSFIERLEEMRNGEDAERIVAIKLPRMSFEITSMNYDAARQLPKTNFFDKGTSGVNTRDKFYTSVPYDIAFELNIYAKSQDDALQLVEQIIPYFNPQYSISVKPFGTDHPEIKEDVPISLTSVTFQDNFEGTVGDRRTIIYTLGFTMKLSFYGPPANGNIIREVNNNIYLMNENEDTFQYNVVTTPTPVGISADSDYGFNIVHSDVEYE
jgi:hypothetical protein